MSDPVILERRDGIAFITLNRLERVNVLDFETSAALIAAIDAVAADGSVRAVLLQARGRHFCAGGNIGDFVESLHDLAGPLDRHIPPLHRAMHTLATLPVQAVSAVNGPIGGGGIGLALSADIALAVESMKLRGGYSAIGLTPDVGSSWLLTRRVGAARAKEIFFTNEPLSASECLALGIVSRVVADGELAGRALALVESLARGPTARWPGSRSSSMARQSARCKTSSTLNTASRSGRVGARRGRGRGHCCVSPEEAVILWRPPAEMKPARTACAGLAIHFN